MLSITEFIDTNEIDIDLKIFNLLYELIQNQSWIYLSSEIIHDYLGYKKSDSSLKNFYTTMKSKFIENIDYREVFKNHEFVLLYKKSHPSKEKRGGALRKYYIISDKTLVLCLAKSNNPTSLRTLEYFYNIHVLLTSYHRYQIIQLELNYDSEIHKIRLMDNNINHTDNQDLKFKQDENKVGFVYFIYEVGDLNYFKIGHTYNLSSRLISLQCGNRRKLNIYKHIKSYNPSKLETVLHNKFKKYLVLNEWFRISENEINECILNNVFELLTIENIR